MAGENIKISWNHDWEKTIPLAKAWSQFSAWTQRMIMTTLIGLGIVALPNTSSAQTDLETWFLNNVDGVTIPVGTQLSTVTNHPDPHNIAINTLEWDCIKIVIVHDPMYGIWNDTLMASSAVWPTAWNNGLENYVTALPWDQVIVIWNDSWNLPICEPGYNSDNNTIIVQGIEATWCIRSEIVLPIELVKFIALCKGKGQGVKIEWATASEINNDWFRVQRSTNWVDRENIAWIDAVGTGTSSGEQEYSMEDTEANDAKVKYYRLQQVDFDWATDYSPIESVTNCDGWTWYDVQMFPNPVVDILNVNITNAQEDLAQKVEVYNMLGQKVGETFARDSWELNVDFSDLPAWSYTVVVTEGNGTNRRVERVIKQ